jgi:hypothetical protein
MGGGKERKMIGGLASANQVKDGDKELKLKFLKTESAIRDILSKNLSAQRSADALTIKRF